MTVFVRPMVGALAAAAFLSFAVAASAAEKVRVALGDVVSVETLAFVVALERAKERGVDYELTSFAKEELAIQAVDQRPGRSRRRHALCGDPEEQGAAQDHLPGDAARVLPGRLDKQYKTWKDLNGQPITFHARGTGTEAIGNIIAKREGIKFGERSYVPGSENRVIAMMNGQIKATIVDLANKNVLMEKAGDRFHVLPGVEQAGERRDSSSPTSSWIEKNAKQVDIIVEELLKLWREMKDNPAIIEEERAKRNLMADQPKEVLDEVMPFYTEAVEGRRLCAARGCERRGRRPTSSSTSEAGQMQGPAGDLKVEDFWYLAPLEARARRSSAAERSQAEACVGARRSSRCILATRSRRSRVVAHHCP